MVSIALPINFTDNSLKEYSGRLRMINHELLHTWITNHPQSGFWYTEGFVCYYAILIASRAHYITQNDAYQSIYAVYDEYINNKYTGKLSPVQAAEKFFDDHHDAGVYCGNTGFLFALLLDVDIRYATQNQRSLDHLMRRMRQRFVPPERGWTYDNLKEIVDELAGIDVLPYIEQYIEGTEVFPIMDVFDKIGLEIRETEDGIEVVESRKVIDLANDIRCSIFCGT
jgi:predicted metalloprotease with PDZ domain